MLELSPFNAWNRRAKISEVDKQFRMPMKVPGGQQDSIAGAKHRWMEEQGEAQQAQRPDHQGHISQVKWTCTFIQRVTPNRSKDKREKEQYQNWKGEGTLIPVCH